MLRRATLIALCLTACASPGASAAPPPEPTSTTTLGPPPAPPLAPDDAPHLVREPLGDDYVQLIVLGDTGEPAPFQARLRAAIQREPSKDGVIVTGDLVYQQAPACPTGTPDADANAILDERVGAIIGGLGAPTWLLIGNHDVSRVPGEAPRAPCITAWIDAHPEHGLVMPATVYTVDLGIAVLAVIDTNALDARTAGVVRRAFDGHPGKKILAGHHVLKTYHDKQLQDVVRPWLIRYGIHPDVYLNGHAHILQFGLYGGIPAVTSGTGATPRDLPTCPPRCGKGEIWGSSVPGYAVVRVGPRRLEVIFKDADGSELFRWQSSRQVEDQSPQLGTRGRRQSPSSPPRRVPVLDRYDDAKEQ